ncbi:MAG TPA: histidinol-phosphate transaminase [Vicinamibacterales bacterium]|nr:histidinol-phosphate transaminase [Vicinamibacterales bacterium]
MTMRLHLNENTAGCSPAVLEALRALTRQDAGFYPDYDEARAAVAACFGVSPDHVLLTNGLDEGILAAAGAALRERTAAVPNAVGVEPAFDMYEVCTTALGGRMVTVPLGEGFTLDTAAVRAAVTNETRIVFLANPHNPSGVACRLSDLRDLASAIAPVTLFVDEAYADFSGETLIDPDTFRHAPNLVVGRTFSKAYGIAGLRAGAVIGAPSTLGPIARVVPPYSLNAWAAAALPVAVADRAYRDWYLEQSAASRGLLQAACERLGLETWPSRANFLLIRVREPTGDIVSALASRGVVVRDRSRERGCERCIRVTAGLVDDTRRAAAALEEVLCAAR